MIRKLLSILCALYILCACPLAMAESDQEYGAALNPYTVESMGITIDLPEGVSVTAEDETDDYVNVSLTMDGRTDVSLAINFTYVEAYADYATISELPEELLQQMADYYNSIYTGGQPGLLQIDDDEKMAMLAPFIAGGKSEDGNTYAVFVNQFNGMQLTVSGGIAGEEFDADAYNAVYSVYWQTLFGMIDAMNAE